MICFVYEGMGDVLLVPRYLVLIESGATPIHQIATIETVNFLCREVGYRSPPGS
jgi:hypothetical protein